MGINVKELIALLRKCKADNYLRIDSSPVSLTPAGVGSYRGFYDDLAIHVDMERSSTLTVIDFVKVLEESVGTIMTGYKGGEYPIRGSTRVWISNYGECSRARVTGVRSEDCGFTLITWELVD